MVKVKLVDIAKASGVSVASVSAALNNTPGVSLARKKKILEIADKLGYQPNIAAQLLKRNHVDEIVLIINELPSKTVGSGIYNSVISEFVQECSREGRRNQIEFTNLNRDEVPQCIAGGLAGGAIHIGVIGPKLKSWLSKHSNFPLIQLDEPSRYCVIFDAAEGMQQAIQHLAAMGHSRIAFIHGPTEFLTHKLSLESFVKLAAEYRLENPEKYIWSFSAGDNPAIMNHSAEIAEKLLTMHEPPSAVICSGISMSRTMLSCAQQRGLSVPEELSIVALGVAAWEAEKTWPMLTSVEHDWKQAVSIAMNMLRRQMSGLEVDVPEFVIDMKLKKRKSVSNIKIINGE